MNKFINWYLNNLIKLNFISSAEYKYYEYQLLCLFESIAVVTTLLIIGIIAHCTINITVFVICFFLIRNRSGGFHLNSFVKCFIGTVLLEVLGIICIKHIPIFMSRILDVLYLVSYIIIMILGTLNHPNLNFDEDEYNASKTISRIVSSLIVILILFLKWIDASEDTIMFIEYAVTLSGILMLIGRSTQQYI